MRNIMHNQLKPLPHRGKQRGALTVFSAILILVLMTVAMLYATRNALFDQRVSSNEQRHRISLNLAEAAVATTLETVVALNEDVIAGTGLFAGQWVPCDGTLTAQEQALCNADIASIVSPNVGQVIHNLGDPASINAIDVAVRAALNGLVVNQPNSTASISLALRGGVGASGGNQTVFMAYGYGFTDCSDVTNLATCQGRSSIAQPLATYPLLAGAPDVPLTSRTSVDLSGSMTIVGNPNAGGVGVPVTVWVDANEGVNEGNGTWQTCELEEWYGLPAVPPDSTCTVQGANGCNCTTAEALSYGSGNTTVRNVDLLEDPSFPDDLFLVFFNVVKSQYQVIKNSAKVLDDCSSLDATSSGLYWIEGDCDIQNGTVGSHNGPVILVGAADINLNGGTIYGVVMCTDAENPGGGNTWEARGNNVIYGSVIVDCNFELTNGTFDLVWAGGVLANAEGISGIGAANGGWRDFDIPAL